MEKNNQLHILLAQHLHQYIPEHVVPLLMLEIKRYPLQVKIVHPRKTCYGTYYKHKDQAYHVITINNDLKNDAFLLTFLHELAHLHTFVQHFAKGFSVFNPPAAHGIAWKRNYQILLAAFFAHKAFSSASEASILKKIQQISAIKSCSNHAIDFMLAHKASNIESISILSQLSSGDFFYFPIDTKKQSELYIKIKNLRSNALCIRVLNNKRYTINTGVQVEKFPIKE